MEEQLVKLQIKGISYSQTQTGAYALILEEEESHKKIPIIIGAFEAQSIAIALENDITPPRPLTHDLFVEIGHLLEFKLTKIVINKLIDGVFFSNLHLETANGLHIVDARTSDACALAVRFNSPIYTTVQILKKAGIYFENDTMSSDEDVMPENTQFEEDIELLLGEDDTNTMYNKLSIEELEQMLEEAVQKEDYELASLIKIVIDKKT